MHLRPAVFVAAIALMLPAGCSQKDNSLDDDVSFQKPHSIGPTKGRSTSLLDRVDEERSQTSGTNQDSSTGSVKSASPGSTQGIDQFAFGSSDVDDFEKSFRTTEKGNLFETSELNPLKRNDLNLFDRGIDQNLLKTDTVETVYKVQFDRGEDLLRRGQFDQALICFDEAKSINPKYYQAYVGEAFAYFRKANYGRAGAAIDQAIRVAPQVVVLYNHRAHISAQLGEFRKAVDDLTHVLKMQPEDLSSLLSRSQCYLQLNNHKAAVADYTAALKLRPNDPSILIQRSVSYFRLGKYTECEADATAVIAQRRDQVDPFFVRALARASLNNMEGGKSDFDEAVKLGLPPNLVTMWRPRFYAK